MECNVKEVKERKMCMILIFLFYLSSLSMKLYKRFKGQWEKNLLTYEKRNKMMDSKETIERMKKEYKMIIF